MIELKGKYNQAKIFTDVVDEASVAQVLRESDHLRGRRPEICTDLTPPLFRP